MTVAGYAPFYMFPLPVVTLAGLFYLWSAGRHAARAAARTGFAFGLGLFLSGVSWVYVSLHDFGAMPAPLAAVATLLFCAFLALFPAAVGLRLRQVGPAGRRPLRPARAGALDAGGMDARLDLHRLSLARARLLPGPGEPARGLRAGAGDIRRHARHRGHRRTASSCSWHAREREGWGRRNDG